MTTWHNVYITDNTGKKFFNTHAALGVVSEIKNLTRHMEAIKANAKGYDFIDKESAQLMLDDVPYGVQVSDVSLDDILLDELFN